LRVLKFEAEYPPCYDGLKILVNTLINYEQICLTHLDLGPLIPVFHGRCGEVGDGERVAYLVANLIRKNKSIRVLNLCGIGIQSWNDACAKLVLTALEENPHILDLTLSNILFNPHKINEKLRENFEVQQQKKKLLLIAKESSGNIFSRIPLDIFKHIFDYCISYPKWNINPNAQSQTRKKKRMSSNYSWLKKRKLFSE